MSEGSDKIISVEDSDTDFMALKFALQAAGVTNPVSRCETGRIALDALIAGDTCPLTQKASLILLDLNLPGIDGRELLKAFRVRDPKRQVPLIVLSTSSHPRDIDDSYKAGADAYMVKPLELEEWETKVGALAGFWLRVRHTKPRPTAGDSASPPDVRPTKKASERTSPEHLAMLTRAIEAEVIPRLLLAHRSDDGQAMKTPVPIEVLFPGGDSVAELARLVLEQDVDAATSYVEAMRDSGATLETVFQVLIAPAARLVGDLWKSDLCDFTQFSQALDRLQQLLVELKPMSNSETMH